MKNYHVYIMASLSKVLYVGVTSDLDRRVSQHKLGTIHGFTSRYRVTRLVHSEHFGNIRDAIEREKEIKKWRREKKIALIERDNRSWKDLAEDWVDAVGDE